MINIYPRLFAIAATVAGVLPVSIPLATTAAATVASPVGSEAAPLFYPVPQKVEGAGKFVKIAALALPAKSPDGATLNVLKGVKTAASGVPVQLVIAGDALKADKKVPGAYRIDFDGKRILLEGFDDAGLFYAAQSLVQMLGRSGGMPVCEIIDWPDVAFRGTVEGFYGKPWEYADRVSQLEFYGKYKLNSYIYGPKNDPFHGFSKRWREFYPEQKAAEMKKLVQVAKDNKVNFIWALHPGQDIQWGEPDRQAALKKFQHMYDLGVRSFAIFFDDIGGTGAEAEGQVEFLNFINREFIQKHPDCTPLVMCPTQYFGGGGKYHDILGEKMDKDIDIMWTGASIVSDIKTPMVESINKRIRRPVYVWWNFPVTDYVRHAVFLGRVYGIDADSVGKLSGFVSNPMDKPEASKIALFGVADITWNAKAFDSDKAWKDGIAALFPECRDAMQTLANHNSDGGRSFHNYRREESVAIAPDIAQAMARLTSGQTLKGMPEAERIKAEFGRFGKAAEAIRTKSGNAALVTELEPWLVDFTQLGKAGQLAVEVASRPDAGKLTPGELGAAIEAGLVLAEMERYSQEISQAINKRAGDNWQKSVKTGTLVMRPFVEEVLAGASPAAILALTGKPLKTLRPYHSAKFDEGVGKMIDADPNSFFYCKEVQKKGDYFGVDLGAPREIRTVELVMGRQDGDHEIVHKGQLESSLDGKTWKNLLPGETAGGRVSYRGEGETARYVRYRATVTGVPGGKPDVWTAIRDFKVNAAGAPRPVTTVESLAKMQPEFQEKHLGLAPLLEVHPMAPGKEVGLEIPDGVVVGKAEVDFKTPDMAWAKFEVTRDGQKWEEIPLARKGGGAEAAINGRVQGARVVNKADKPVDINLAAFKLHYPVDKDSRQAQMLDGKLQTSCLVALTAKPYEVALAEAGGRELVVVSDGKPAEVQALGEGGKWTALGKITGTVTKLALPEGARAIGFSGKEGTRLQVLEVLVN